MANGEYHKPFDTIVRSVNSRKEETFLLEMSMLTMLRVAPAVLAIYYSCVGWIAALSAPVSIGSALAENPLKLEILLSINRAENSRIRTTEMQLQCDANQQTCLNEDVRLCDWTVYVRLNAVNNVNDQLAILNQSPASLGEK